MARDDDEESRAARIKVVSGSRSASTTLTAQQIHILRQIAEGKTTPRIARELVLTERAVKWHVANILRKLGVGTRAAAVAVASARGILGGSARPEQPTLAPGRERSSSDSLLPSMAAEVQPLAHALLRAIGAEAGVPHAVLARHEADGMRVVSGIGVAVRLVGALVPLGLGIDPTAPPARHAPGADYASAPGAVASVLQCGVRAVLSEVIVVHSEVAGFLSFCRTSPGPFDRVARDALRCGSEQAAALLRLALLVDFSVRYERLARRPLRETAPDHGALVERITADVRAVLGVEHAVMARFEGRGVRLVASGRLDPEAEADLSQAAALLQLLNPGRSQAEALDASWPRGLAPAEAHERGATLVARIVVGGAVAGALLARTGDSTRHFDAVDRHGLEILAATAALAF